MCSCHAHFSKTKYNSPFTYPSDDLEHIPKRCDLEEA